jgi:DNA-binding HxlR family transcriptional regulator
MNRLVARKGFDTEEWQPGGVHVSTENGLLYAAASDDNSGMDRLQTYGQYCGMARGAEIFATPWTPIIVRNVLLGASTFGEILEGAPGLSRTLLSQRLRMLQRYGVIEQDQPSGRRPTYRPTEVGVALGPVIESLGRWGEQWLNMADHHLDAGVVLWTLARLVGSDLLPEARTVVRVEVADDRRGRFWLLADPAHVELCLRPPGGSDDAVIRTTCDALTRWHLGEITLPHAMRDGLISAEGARGVVRMFGSWGGTGSFLRHAHAPH